VRCPVCGEEACRERWLEGLVARRPGAAMGEWASTEHVWGVDELGRRVLVYAPGDPVPEEEARRQGLVGGKAKAAPEETKHLEAPPETKTPQGPPARPSRKGTVTRRRS
jgi:hypothetical protein